MPKKIDNRIRQMFDVRPVGVDGFFDQEKFKLLEDTLDLRKKEALEELPENNFTSVQKETSEIFPVEEYTFPTPEEYPEIFPQKEVFSFPEPSPFLEEYELPNTFSEIPSLQNDFASFPKELPKEKSFTFPSWQFFRPLFPALGAFLLIIFLFGAGFFVVKGLRLKGSLLAEGKKAYASLNEAKDSVLNKDFSRSTFQFQSAYEDFDKISKDLNSTGGFLADLTKHLPILSKLSSGKYLAETGKNVSRIGVLAIGIAQKLEGVKNPLQNTTSQISFLKIFQDVDQNLTEISGLLAETEKNLEKINVDDIPEEQRLKFVELKERLPEMKKTAEVFMANSDILKELLGGNGPRKYLFLFQNNQEIRATGGFIGSYGLLEVFDGRIQKFFIDGIFNPDGQLKEKVVPPAPIQKISAAWSLHDSNWFPDFPVSAEKAAWFYEKTGGPTVDGVITITPEVLEKFLGITGPIEMPEYGVIVSEKNFREIIQQEVEVDYDKELNQPKKILSDLAPIILERIFNTKSFSDFGKIAGVLQGSLKEKQILIYSKNYNIQKMISQLGWSGEILKTEKDYLSVINSNINGFKTDGVVEEKIELNVEIEENGEIVNEVIITRKHNGGDTDYDWWNRVNANYMRVYVPKGSKLISAEGHTREFSSPPLDYKALNFRRDPQVEQEELGMEIDEESGTRIYEDAGKTVFANWAYVSPQETVVVKYKYLLPYRLEIDEAKKNIGTYSLVAQKQSGSSGSKLNVQINFPENYQSIWNFPEELKINSGVLELKTDLIKDKYIGVAFSK